MAVPCLVNVTSDEDNLRRLERILCELFLVLRALLVHPSPEISNQHHHQAPGGGPPPPPQGGSGPGNVPSSGISRLQFLSGRNPSSNSGRNSTPSQTTPKGGKTTSRASWQQLGCELRHIADNLSSKRNTPTVKLSPVKTSSFSLAVSVCRLMLGGGGDAD